MIIGSVNRVLSPRLRRRWRQLTLVLCWLSFCACYSHSMPA